jgi:hypothetical protein
MDCDLVTECIVRCCMLLVWGVLNLLPEIVTIKCLNMNLCLVSLQVKVS